MKKLLLIFVPPLVAFLVFALVIRLDRLYHQISFSQISDGTLHSLMAYFYFFSPLLFIDAVLTQGLFVIPLWRWLKHSTAAAKTTALGLLVVICLVFSLGVSFMMWGSVAYFANWMRSCLIMIAVQLAYWLIVISLLSLIDRNKGKGDVPTAPN